MTVIVGYIDTPAGHAALTTGIVQAAQQRTDLLVVNASREPTRSDPNRLSAEVIARLRTRLSEEGAAAEVVQPQGEDDTAEHILALAAERDASLIVLGTRRRTPVGKFLLGSTVQKVILDADCPVLCVKAAHSTD